MDFNEYFSKEQIVALIERDFPFIVKPADDELFSVDSNDLIRRILSKEFSAIRGDQLGSDELYCFYDEFGTISSTAVQWIFPSFIRMIVREPSSFDPLLDAFVFYFEHPEFEEPSSAYCFNWLTSTQAETLCRVLDYISRETDQIVSIAIENVTKFGDINAEG